MSISAPTTNASKLTSGTLNAAQLPTVAARTDTANTFGSAQTINNITTLGNQSSDPTSPSAAAVIYAKGSKLRAKHPNGGIATLSNWSKYSGGVTVNGNGADQLAHSFSIPANTYEIGDAVKVTIYVAYGSGSFTSRIRINGSAWAGNVGSVTSDVGTLVTVEFTLAHYSGTGSDLIAYIVRQPGGGSVPGMGQIYFGSASVTDAAMTVDIGINAASGQSITTWYAIAQIIKGSY